MDIKDVIWGRRSVRHYENTPVSDEDIKEILEGACMAPSGINLQPWYYVVVKSKEKLKELTDITGQVFPKFKPVLDKRFSKNTDTITQTQVFLDSLGGASCCILVFMLKPDYEDSMTVLQGISASIQNLCLMAHHKGLATCWMTAALRVGLGEEIRKKFAPDKGSYVAMITLGYPAVIPKAPQRRAGRFEII